MAEKIISKTRATYADLKSVVQNLGYLNRQPLYYTLKIVFTFLMLAASIVVILITDVIWIQAINAIFLGFVFGQIGFLGHDFGHQQVFRKPKHNSIFGLTFANFFLAMSYRGWVEKHNAHHVHSNDEDNDPDCNMGLYSFTKEQARSKKGLAKFVSKYQAILYYPILIFGAFHLRFFSIKNLIKSRAKNSWFELGLIVMHFAWYFVLVFLALPTNIAILFILVHQATMGVYWGIVFAPNHKGMPMLKTGEANFLLRQILTSRNVLGRHWVDFFYGGLNFQIEHHLFPRMSRNKLRKAQKVVEKFCQHHNISYHATNVRQSFKEIVTELHNVSAPLRKQNTV